MGLDNRASIDGINSKLPKLIINEFNLLRDDLRDGFFRGKEYNDIILLVTDNKYSLYNKLNPDDIKNINNSLKEYIKKNKDLLDQNSKPSNL
jgi:hypothetical protein